MLFDLEVTRKEAVAVIGMISECLERRGTELDRAQLSALGKMLGASHFVLTENKDAERFEVS